MQTYKNGATPAVGDAVIGAIGEKVVSGIVHSFGAGEAIKIIHPEIGRSVYTDVNANDFYRADHALEAAELIRTGKVQPIVGATPTA